MKTRKITIIDPNDQAMIIGLVYLGCEALNDLFVIDPLKLCPHNDTNNLLEFWSLHKSSLLYDWYAISSSAADGIFEVRKDPSRRFIIRAKVTCEPPRIQMPWATGLLIETQITLPNNLESAISVCDGLYYPLDEGNCHLGWAKKLYCAMTTYNITKLPVPRH